MNGKYTFGEDATVRMQAKPKHPYHILYITAWFDNQYIHCNFIMVQTKLNVLVVYTTDVVA